MANKLLREFLIQRAVIGLNKEQVSELFSDCKGIPPGCLRNAQTNIFQIFDASKLCGKHKNSKQQDKISSLCLEVRFFKNKAYAFRIQLETFRKREPIDPNVVLMKPITLGFMYRLYINRVLESLVSQVAEKEGINENDVEQECIVEFNVAKNGEIRNVKISRSSLNPKFDQIVLRTVREMSGRPGMRSPTDVDATVLRLPIHLLVSDVPDRAKAR